MRLYVADRRRWRRTVAGIGVVSTLALLARIWVWDLVFIIDFDTVAFTISLVAWLYVATTGTEGR